MSNVSNSIRRAYAHQNAARHLLVKGDSDYIVHEKQVILKMDHFSCEVMEAIGGTGDALTGMLSILCGTDFEVLTNRSGQASSTPQSRPIRCSINYQKK